MSSKLLVQPSSGAVSGNGTGEQPANCGTATGMELISGPQKSSTPLPLGPLVHSYEGCLSVHAVVPPAALTASNMVFTRRYSCGRMVLQPLLGSRTKNFGFKPPP